MIKQHISKPGDIRVEKGFFKDSWTVFVEMKEGIWRGVEFRDFENAEIFSAIIKLKDALYTKGVKE